jgi:hypothetical protein
MRQLLTGEANAAVEGFLTGGAEEVIVWDGHDGSQTLSTLTIHPKAKLLKGALGPSTLMDRHFSAVAYVGQHSKANVRGGIMAHSYSSLGIQNMLLNCGSRKFRPGESITSTLLNNVKQPLRHLPDSRVNGALTFWPASPRISGEDAQVPFLAARSGFA